jgi:arylsulfatase A-like enzyme
VTLSQHFMAHGYTAAGCGKIFHGGFNDQASWNEYMTRAGGSLPRGATAPRGGSEPGSGPAAAEEAPARRNRGEGLVRLAWTPLDVTDGETSDGRVVDWAAGFLARRHDKPFFLAVGLQRPHLPWNVPRKYFALFPPAEVKLPQVKADDLDDVPAPGRGMANPEGDHRQLVESGKFQEAVAAYLASIAFADAQIGSLLDALEKSPYAANTIVIFFGDHGWHLGEKLHWRKLTLWEEATRVPLILAAPGVTRPGERCERTVSLLDLYPTLCELCNLGPGKNLEGQSLVPLLRNPAAAWQRPAVTTCFHQNHAVRSERWRYIRYADGSEELYDHDKDPLEWTNLAADPALAAVKKELAGWLPRVNAEESKTPAGGETVKPKGL